MQTSAFRLGFLALLVSGCGGGGTTGDMSVTPDFRTSATPDLSMMAAPDLSMTATPDMAMATTPDMAMTAKPDMAMTAIATPVAVGQGGNNFSPSTVTIPVGGTVMWTWASNNHNVVSGMNAADGKFCSPTDMNCNAAPTSITGTKYSHTFTAAGTYPYFCAPHLGAGMKGTVIVQ